MKLEEKNILITGAARRVGKAIALGIASRGAHVIIHYGRSSAAAVKTQAEISRLGGESHLIQADLEDPMAVAELIPQALQFGPLFALVNNASIFENQRLADTNLAAWNRHLQVNLTAPFILSQAFAASVDPGMAGRIINILDWRALRPGADHLPYTVSKAALAALTQSLAVDLAPRIQVNGVAFGAILPPSDGADSSGLINAIPARRWAALDEVVDTLTFLLSGPEYITGEIIHLDGGRHLV